MENAYVRTAQEGLAYFNVSEETGLSGARVKEQTQKYGRNGMRDFDHSIEALG